MVQRYLRGRGELRCEIVAWTGSAISPGVYEQHHFEVKFFNEKEVGVGLWNVEVAFYNGGEYLAGLYPAFTSTGQPVEVLNVPPRIPLSWSMKVEAGGPNQLPRVKRADKVKLVAEFPGGETFEKEMPTWET